MTEFTPEQTRRAFEIADRAMFEQMCCEAVPQDANETAYALVDEAAKPVTTLAAASEAIRGAFAWLRERGMAELASDAGGEYIVVVRRPWE